MISYDAISIEVIIFFVVLLKQFAAAAIVAVWQNHESYFMKSRYL